MQTRSRSAAKSTLSVEDEARRLQEKRESSVIQVDEFCNEVVRLAQRHKATHTLGDVVALFPAQTQNVLSKLLSGVTTDEIHTRFDGSKSERLYTELKSRALNFPLDKVMDALAQARESRKAGNGGTGVGKLKVWAPSDVKKAVEILQQEDETNPVIGDMPDIESPEGQSVPTVDKDTINAIPGIEEHEGVGHTHREIDPEHPIPERSQELGKLHCPEPHRPLLVHFESNNEEHDDFTHTEEQLPERGRKVHERRTTHFFAKDPESGSLEALLPDTRSSLSPPLSSPPPLHHDESTTAPQAHSSPISISKTSRSPTHLQHRDFQRFHPPQEMEDSETEALMIEASMIEPASPVVSEVEVSMADDSEKSQMAPSTDDFASLSPGEMLTGAAISTCLRLLCQKAVIAPSKGVNNKHS
ncbi:hypothetical protein CSUB01_04613 [Colletotrichum sublineola]|uniref:Uncharacterized protein n=1 Tax=Colletotrichum sublineola TaxID=1173701 RepID=A0A066X4I8_COLSU|nr:hypothetical protein CSUB01_04613 [Colletotrichum sublineola]